MTTTSARFDSLYCYFVNFPEGKDTDNGFFISPTDNIDVTGFSLTAVDATGKVEWVESGSNILLGDLLDVDLSGLEIGDVIAWDGSFWIPSPNPGTSAAIASIASLTTSANQLIYTIATNTYATSALTSNARGFLSASNSSQQRSLLELVPGVDVQAFSLNLTDLNTIGQGAANNIIYTTGTGFSNSALSSFVRTTVLPAADASALATILGSFVGTATTVNSVMRVSASNTLSETIVTIDTLGNVAGINDMDIDGDLTVTGTINVAGNNAFAQIANIGATTISATQWGYLGELDQSLTTISTPTFVGASMGSGKITSLADPTSGQDAATKSYVDTVAATGSPPLESVNATTSTILPNSPVYASPAETLTSTGGPGVLVVDGVTLLVGNRVLVKNQADNRENGIYIVTDDGATPGPNYVLTRSSDFNQAVMPLLAGTPIFTNIDVNSIVNKGTTWSLQTTVTTIDPLTDPVTFVQIAGINIYEAGSGINVTELASSNIQVDISARLKFTGNTVDLNTVTVPYGGTGLSTLTSGNVLIGQGTSAVDITKVAPTGVFVGTTDAQTLTNKTITDSTTNNIVARSLAVGSGGGAVSTFAAVAPSVGQVLTAVSGTVAEWQTLSAGSFEPDRTLFVYQSATNVSPNWSTLEAALADAVILTPSVTNPVIIFIYPGTYAEATPLLIPAYVTISGMTSAQSSVIITPVAPAPVGAVITVVGNARLYGILIDGSDGAGGYSTYGVESIVGVAYSLDYCNSVTVRNCSIAGFAVIGNGTNKYSKILSCKNTSSLLTASFPFTCDAGYLVEDGGLLTGTDITSSGFLTGGGTLVTALKVINDFSFTDITNIQFSSCNTGIYVGGGTTTNSSANYPFARITGCRLGFIVEKSIDMIAKSSIYLSGLIITDDTGTFPNQIDLYITNPSTPADPNVLQLFNCSIRISRISIANGAINNPTNITGLAYSTELNDEQAFFLSNLVVGYPLSGKELVVGEGNSHTISMVVLQDDSGVFTDVTTDITSEDSISTTTDLATTAAINLASAPATIDGVAPTSGVTVVLVKDGSTVNVGTDSVDNGVYIWNGTGAAMTRAVNFEAGDTSYYEKSFFVLDGDLNYGNIYNIDPSTFPGDIITFGTTSFGFEISTITPFPKVSPQNNDALYIGSDSGVDLLFPGIKIQMTKPITLSSGTLEETIIWEFWNGTSWQQLSLMSTLANYPYTPKTYETFAYGDANVGNPDIVNYQYRFGDMTGWATTAVNGVTGYWVRSRLIDATKILQVPVMSRIKIHTNRSEINKNGFMEFFGSARPQKVLSIMSDDTVDPGNGSGYSNPGSQRLVPDASGLISVNIDKCQFNDGANTAGSYVTKLPLEIDTSQPLQFTVSFAREDISSGNAVFRLRYCITKAGYQIGTPAGTKTATTIDSGNIIVAIAASGSPIQEYTFNLDITKYNSSEDQIWFMFSREGTNGSDTFGGELYVYTWNFKYINWCVGLDNY